MRVIIVVAVALLLAGLAAGLWIRARSKRDGAPGFREWVRNPEIRESMGDVFAARDRAVADLVTLPPADLVAMLLEEDFDLPRRAIEESGPKVVPGLLAALEDPRFRVKVPPEVKARTHVLSSRSEPLETVLRCLVEHAPVAALPRVAPLVRDADEDIRRAAARLLGAIGTDACVESLMIACEDEKDFVRSSAMSGVAQAVETGRATAGFRAGAYRAILPLLYRRDRTVSGDAPRCLLALDRAAAIKVMTRPENLVAGVEGLQYVLRALREAKVSVDEGALLKLAESLEGQLKEYPAEYVVAEVAMLLARANSPAAEAMLRRCATSPSAKVRDAVFEGLAERAGIVDPYGYAFGQLDALGWERITPAQRHVLAVRQYIDQVNNGGFSQYFVNSPGGNWRLAEVGLSEMGSTVLLSILRRAVAKFGDASPSEDDDVRHRQLAKLVKQQGDDVFSELDSALYKDEEFAESLLWRYILKHPSDFKSPR